VTRIRIVSDGALHGTEVTVCETGQKIPVARAHIDIGPGNQLNQAVLHLPLPRVDIVAEAHIKMCCPYCKRLYAAPYTVPIDNDEGE
jgi:hypothetical protein